MAKWISSSVGHTPFLLPSPRALWLERLRAHPHPGAELPRGCSVSHTSVGRMGGRRASGKGMGEVRRSGRCDGREVDWVKALSTNTCGLLLVDYALVRYAWIDRSRPLDDRAQGPRCLLFALRSARHSAYKRHRSV